MTLYILLLKWQIEILKFLYRWHDGFSVFYLGSDGLVHKLTADKVSSYLNMHFYIHCLFLDATI